jgi:universal stress protein A
MEIRTVLCPIDFSQLADRELDLAVEVCRASGAQLVLHHNVSAISPGFSKAWEWDQTHRKTETSAADAERRVQALLQKLPAGVRGEAVITHGPLATILLTIATDLPADLLVLGTHGWSTEDHASVTERVIDRTPCPVLTVRDAAGLENFRLAVEPDAEMPLVVVPTDFSPAANRAVAYATELARAFRLRLHLLRIVHDGDEDEALATLDAMVPPDLRGQVECHAHAGRPDEEIEKFIRRVEPQLIVMGTHARSFWRHLFTRDVARQILHEASCPVWFVPPTTRPERG